MNADYLLYDDGELQDRFDLLREKDFCNQLTKSERDEYLSLLSSFEITKDEDDIESYDYVA